jgi:molybdate transport system permease protein
MPFFVVTVEAALRGSDPGLDDTARTLGASSWYSFRRVTLPGIRSALVAGALLSWARAFGEFGATLTFAGNFPGKTQTLPLSVYSTLGTDRHQAITVALVMVVVSFGVLVALRGRWLGGGDPTL